MADEPKPCDCPKWGPKEIIGLVSALAAVVGVIVSSLNNRGIQNMNERPHGATPEQVEQAVERKTPTADAVADKVITRMPPKE